jgi:hydroxyacylglutathione hydrolase
MKIYQLPAFRDNYIFLLYDAHSGTAAVVDPGDATPVLHQLEQLQARLVAIFNTHHHSDHVGGNRRLMQAFPDLVVYGGAVDRGRIPGQQVFLQDGDRVKFADRSAVVMYVPGHTQGHIAYYFPPVEPGQAGELFSGDVIFSAGCGRLFEGTPQQAVDSLARLRQLPDDTRIWCAHEYTLSNLQFALAIEPRNQALQHYHEVAISKRAKAEPTVPTTIGLEKQINPFLRWDVAAIQQQVDQPTAAATFGELRRRKEAV